MHRLPPRHAGARMRPLLAAVVAVASLAGCTDPTLLWSKPLILPCPDYRIPAEAANLVAFREGPGRDLTDVDHQGRIVNVRLACAHEIDEDTGTGMVEVDVTPILAVERGPADTDKQATYPYFIAVTDTEQNILFRERLTQKAAFTGNRTRQVFGAQKSTLEIPLSKDKRGKDYIVYVGFDLDREQVEFNRKQIEDRSR